VFRFIFLLKWYSSAFLTDRTLTAVLNAMRNGSVDVDEVRYLLNGSTIKGQGITR